MNSVADSPTFPIYLPVAAHQLAAQYRQLQTNAQRGKQAYLNTLATYAVDYYLRCLGWSTAWERSDSRNPAILRFLDVADLMLPQLGRLECRPLLPEATALEIPTETLDDRIGYVAVQLSPDLETANLLGFVPIAAASIPLRDLRSIEQLLLHLEQRGASTVNLRQWLTGIVDQSWQSLSELLTPAQLAYEFRSRNSVEITRGQVVDLGLQMGEQSVALALTIATAEETAEPTAEGAEVTVWARVYPMRETHLPPEVQLIIDDETGTRLESCSREADDFIQQEFTVMPGEAFSITVALAASQVTKTFTV
jgi:hypothetical protein